MNNIRHGRTRGMMVMWMNVRCARCQLLPRVWQNGKRGENIGTTSEVYILGENTRDIETTGKYIPHDVDRKLGEDEDNSQEESCSASTRAVTILDLDKQRRGIPESDTVSVLYRPQMSVSNPGVAFNSM